MSQQLTNSQRVVAKVFREKLQDSLVSEEDLAGCIERLIVHFDSLTTRLSSANVKDFVKQHMQGTGKDKSVIIRNTLCALCIFMMTDDLTSCWDKETMKQEFKDAEEFSNIEGSEWDRLLKYQAIVKTAHDLFGGVGQKGRVLFIANHLTGIEVTEDSLHGQKMATGSGASKATRRRCMIYHRISAVPLEKRDQAAKGKKRPHEEMGDELPPAATAEERELQEGIAMLENVKHNATLPVPASSSSSATLLHDPVAVALDGMFPKFDFSLSPFYDLSPLYHDGSAGLS